MVDGGEPHSLPLHEQIDAYLLGKLVLADKVATRCGNAERQSRMRRAVATFTSQLGVASVEAAFIDLQQRSLAWDRMERTLILVDLWEMQPFSPYDIDVSKDDKRSALRELANAIDAGGAIGQIERAVRELNNRARIRTTAKVGGAVVLGAVALGATGFAAAPFIGTALGGAMGLSGAAATSAGLATLGGGALAAGGAGMAGGTLLVTGAAAASGGLIVGGGTALFQLGSRQAQQELRKMEVKFKVALFQTHAEIRVAQQFATRLHGEIETLPRTPRRGAAVQRTQIETDHLAREAAQTVREVRAVDEQ